MKGKHKTLADGTGVGVGWLMVGPISQVQWVVAQRQEFDRLQQGRGGGPGNGDQRNMNNGGCGYAQEGDSDSHF